MITEVNSDMSYNVKVYKTELLKTGTYPAYVVETGFEDGEYPPAVQWCDREHYTRAFQRVHVTVVCQQRARDF